MTTRDETMGDREIIISRLVEGPRRLVFEAFTDAEHLDRWWGPTGFRNSTSAFEFRVGGAWVYVMHGPDGTDYQNRVDWLEIVPPERLRYRLGEREDDPKAFESTITLEDRGETTMLTMRMLFPSKQQRDFVIEHYGAIEGGEQTLGRLAAYVAEEMGGPS